MVLGLSDNLFSGSLTDAFTSFPQLQTIDVANNKLTGPIPRGIFDVPTLRLVYLSNNVFTGPIPDNYGSADQLRDLYLDGNRLTMMIPPIADGELLNLNELLLNNNSLTGSMPESICALREPNGILEDLWADCDATSGESAKVTCMCCTQCIFDDT